MTEKKDQQNVQYTVGNWTKGDIPTMHKLLEEPNWAPWLAASMDSLSGRTEVFPEGQLLVKSLEGIPLASLSMNRINWDGNPESLPSWDDVAGDPTTYENTHVKDGNALVLMSMNVHPEHQGEGLARKLIESAKAVGNKLGVDYIIGSFRPNEFGKYKLQGENWKTPFEKYCKMTREEDGLPIDAWLRNLTRNGMKPLKVDMQAMTVNISFNEWFDLLPNLKHGKEVFPNLYECEEVGNWYVERGGGATYKESNLWGILWSKTGLP